MIRGCLLFQGFCSHCCGSFGIVVRGGKRHNNSSAAGGRPAAAGSYRNGSSWLDVDRRRSCASTTTQRGFLGSRTPTPKIRRPIYWTSCSRGWEKVTAASTASDQYGVGGKSGSPPCFSLGKDYQQGQPYDVRRPHCTGRVKICQTFRRKFCTKMRFYDTRRRRVE